MNKKEFPRPIRLEVKKINFNFTFMAQLGTLEPEVVSNLVLLGYKYI